MKKEGWFSAANHLRNQTKRLLDKEVAWQMHSMMESGMAKGSARGVDGMLIENPFRGAGKGGTTHDFADTWFLGYNKRVTCGVWTGFLRNNDSIYPGAFSRDISMPVWAAAMNAAAPAFGGDPIERPESMTAVEICSVSGQRATQFCQDLKEDVKNGSVKSVSTAFTEYFRTGQGNLPFCTLHSGALSGNLDPGDAIGTMPALDVLPIRPKSPVLIGEDPYHTEMPSYAASSAESGLIRRSTNVLDSLDLDEYDEPIKMRRPPRLEIHPD